MDQKGVPFWSPFGPKRAPLLVPFWARKGSHLGSPFGPKGDRKWARNKYLPGSGRSPGRRLSLVNAVKIEAAVSALHYLIKKRVPFLVAFWSKRGAQMGPLSGPKGDQKGGPFGTKRGPKWDPFLVQKGTKIGPLFGPKWGPLLVPFWSRKGSPFWLL